MPSWNLPDLKFKDMDLTTNTGWQYWAMCSQNTLLIVQYQKCCYKKCKILGLFCHWGLLSCYRTPAAKNILFTASEPSLVFHSLKCKVQNASWYLTLGKISLNSLNTGWWTWIQSQSLERWANTLAWGAQIQWRNSRCRRWRGLGRCTV